MGKQELAMLIPILALAIPVVAIVLNGMQKLAKLRLEEARLRITGGGEPADAAEIQSLRHEVEIMRGELNELQERVDFAERLLASPRAPAPSGDTDVH